jgi:Nitrile hydratase beta subunit
MKTIPSDIGGEPAGAVDTHDHGMKHWERQANAFRSVVQMTKLTCTDELRRAAEDLGERYKDMHYFEITTSAMRKLLLEKGVISEQELQTKMAEIRARFNVPDEMESPIKKAASKAAKS